MSAIPAFEIGVWNAWIFIVPYLLFNFGLTFLTIDRKSIFWHFPSYTKVERISLFTWYLIMVGLWIYSIFLPLNISTAWFYAGLFVYLLGWILLISAMMVFMTTPVDKPNTTGIYRFSRHPWYLGMLVVYFGAGIASASWVYLLLALLYLGMYRNALFIPEERMCCERFGDAYREYMNRTPRWVGVPKS